MNLAERIRELRGDKSIVDFCRQTNIHRNTLPRYESGDRLPDSAFLEAACKAFNINPSWLLLGVGPKYMAEEETVETASPPKVGIDEQLMTSVLEAVEEYLTQERRQLPPAKKAQLVTALYDMFMESEEKKVNKAVVIRLAKLAA